MIDRKKMINALRDIADYFCACRKNAVTNGAAARRFEIYVEAAEEAAELLKAQEPRVLTLGEVMQYIGYSEKVPPKEREKLPLWTESRNGTGVISGYRDVDNLRYLIDMSGLDANYIAYKHWRCWSSKPTDEQREAVKWDV